MPDHKIGTREEWQAARDELAKLEAEHAELGQKVTEQRRQLPWVPVEKEYQFDTEHGKKTLDDLFDGRSQLLAYNIMFGPDYEIGACPGCSNLGDELDGTRVHLNHRDVTLDLLLACADRSAHRIQGADGLAVPVRLDLWDGVSLRLRARPHARAGERDPGGPGNARRSPRVAPRLEPTGRSQARGRPARKPELHRLRPRQRERVPHLHGVGARSIRRSRTTRSCSTERRSLGPRSRAPGARTSIRTDR